MTRLLATVLMSLLLFMPGCGWWNVGVREEAPSTPATLEELQTQLTKLQFGHTINLAKIKNTFAEEKAAGGLEARRDLISTVKRVSWFLIVVFAGLGIVSLLGTVARLAGSANPIIGALGTWMPFGARSAAFWFGCVGITVLARHLLERWGETLSTAVFWVLVAAGGVTFLAVGLPMAWAWVRTKLLFQSKALAAKDEPRAAVALAATALGLTKGRHAIKRKDLLASLTPPPAPVPN